MKSYRKAAATMKPFNTIGSDVLNQSPPQRFGYTTIMWLLEILMLGVVVWCVVYVIPELLFTGHSKGITVKTPILKLISTSNGSQIWAQLGTREVVAIDMKTRESRLAYQRQTHAIGNWGVSEDGATFLISNDDSEVQVLRNEVPIAYERLFDARQLMSALSANGLGAVRISNGTSARYWHLSQDEPLEVEFALKAAAQTIGVDPTGKLLAVATGQSGLDIYDLPTGTLLHCLDYGSLLPKEPVFSHDGKSLAIIRGSAIAMFDPRTGELVWTSGLPDSEPFISLSFSPDGSLLAASGVTMGIQIFDCATGRLRSRLPSNLTLHRIAFASNDTLYSGSTDGLIRIWSLSEGKEIEQLRLNHENRKSGN